MSFSIRAKIVVLSVAATLAILGILFVAINVLYSQGLKSSIDQNLLQDIQRVESGLQFDANGKLILYNVDGTSTGLTYSNELNYFLWDAESLRPLRRSVSMMRVEIPKTVLHTQHQQPYQEFEFAGREYRIITSRYPANPVSNRQPILIQALSSLDAYYAEIERLRMLFMYLTPACLMLAVAAAWWVASRALKPVHELITKIASINPQSLDQRVNINRQDEVGQLADAFNALLGKLHNAFEQLKRFTADASHELRTPLTVIKTQTEVALSKPRDTAYYQNLTANVLEEINQLQKLSESLLLLSRGEGGLAAPHFKRSNISSVVENWLDNLLPLAEEKSLRIEKTIEANIILSFDQASIDSVVSNILDNAIKYAEPGGKVCVSLCKERLNVVLKVCNTAPPIAQSDVARIFDRFVRLPQNRHSVMGSGLGLSIARMAAHLHKGEVELVKNEGHEICFAVTLPHVE